MAKKSSSKSTPLVEENKQLADLFANESPTDDDINATENEALITDSELQRPSISNAFTSWLKQIAEIPLLTPAEEYALTVRIANGDKEARKQLIEANLRLVVSIAKHFFITTATSPSMDIMDIVNSGNLGLIKAVERFDNTRGYKFGTYATWWVRQAINRTIAEQSRTIRLPVHVSETHMRIVKATRALEQELNRDPTLDEISTVTHLSTNKITETMLAADPILSLDVPVNHEEGDATIRDIIAADEKSNPQNNSYQTQIKDLLAFCAATLTERERTIIELRFGMQDGKKWTLEECGQEFDITRERVRQIENAALKKMRNRAKKVHLQDYI